MKTLDDKLFIINQQKIYFWQIGSQKDTLLLDSWEIGDGEGDEGLGLKGETD